MTAIKEAYVFPAHAGMDRYPQVCSAKGYECSPHTRGWTEWRIVKVYNDKKCSPHTRGWTVEKLLEPDTERVFPAHAGMDRSNGSGPPHHSRRVPRTRGDGPWVWEQTRTRNECSPHTRGWTVDQADWGHECQSVPRTRGDGPDGVQFVSIPFDVFPAHAGMDRQPYAVDSWHRGRVPRTRGDGPP